MKRSAPLRCNNCEGCERNLKGEDCQECRYCKDKKKYGGPDKLRKPCEKRKCTVVSMGRSAIKSVFRVPYKVRFKPASSATETI